MAIGYTTLQMDAGTRKVISMDEAIIQAKQKIAMFPEMYKDYIEDQELFMMLVEDCRKQNEFVMFSRKFLMIGGVTHEQGVV